MIVNYWNTLNEREKWLLGMGSLCVFFYLFYLLLYSPLTTAVTTQSKLLLEKQETLAWMEQVRIQPKQQKMAQVITNTKLLALIGNQLNKNSLGKLSYQLQQTATGDIQLSYDRVPFNPFLSWLWNLNKDYVLALKQLRVERTNTPGVVKLLVVLAAP